MFNLKFNKSFYLIYDFEFTPFIYIQNCLTLRLRDLIYYDTNHFFISLPRDTFEVEFILWVHQL